MAAACALTKNDTKCSSSLKDTWFRCLFREPFKLPFFSSILVRLVHIWVNCCLEVFVQVLSCAVGISTLYIAYVTNQISWYVLCTYGYPCEAEYKTSDHICFWLHIYGLLLLSQMILFPVRKHPHFCMSLI